MNLELNRQDEIEGLARGLGPVDDHLGRDHHELSTVLPVLEPALGIDVTADLVREVGAEVVQTAQAVGGLVCTILTIYRRARASQPLTQRAVSMKI